MNGTMQTVYLDRAARQRQEKGIPETPIYQGDSINAGYANSIESPHKETSITEKPDYTKDLKTEKALLASMLLLTEAREYALDTLSPLDIYDTTYRAIFEEIGKQRTGDTILLAEGLKPQFPEIEITIAEILDAGSSSNVAPYCQILKGKSLVRSLQKASCRAIERGENPFEVLKEFDQERAAAELINNDSLPAIVWGAHYLEHGIPDRKPELINGILRQSHKMLISAPSKACKSFLAIRLALAIAGGHEWLGFPCKKGNVYLVNFEIDDGSYMHRVQAVAGALKWSFPENIAYHHLRGESQEIEILFPAIARRIKGNDISALIIDPQYKMFQSSKIKNFSENDSVAMAYLYGEIDRYFCKNGISVIPITHFAKGNAAGKEVIDRAVGSGVQARDVDAYCALTELESKNCYRMEFLLREFMTPEPISLRWEYPLHHTDSMLDDIPLKKNNGSTSSTIDDDALVLKTIEKSKEAINQGSIVALLAGKLSKEKVRNSLARLVNNQKAKAESEGKSHALYYTKI